jgi:two-component system cell cycle sensor histidine kinase/response regulator CckA
VKDSAGQILNYVAVKRDITENLRLGEEKAELQEQLLQSQKLESIGRLAGGVAHDFNNMLGVIIGYGETILDRLHDGDPLRDDVQQIVQAGGRSAALVGQLLAFSRRQNLKPTVLEPNDVIRDLEPMLRRLSGEAVDMELILAKDSGRVLADRSQIEQVVMNLVVNARDAMPEGGRLLIETAPVELDAAYVHKHPVVTPGRYVLLSVTDMGLGMDKETLRQVFDPFFTTKGRDGGTGLGLATVYGIVKQSGGSIWAYSEPGHGTTFKVYLPRTDAVQEDTPIAQEAARTKGGNEKVLVVEDEESLRRLMASILSPLGYQVTLASDGEEALRLVEEQGLKPDLVITDVIMPRMSGSQLVERLRRDWPDLRVLYMSGYTDNAIVRHGVLEADVSFLQKPFSVREVALKVREILLG